MGCRYEQEWHGMQTSSGKDCWLFEEADDYVVDFNELDNNNDNDHDRIHSDHATTIKCMQSQCPNQLVLLFSSWTPPFICLLSPLHVIAGIVNGPDRICLLIDRKSILQVRDGGLIDVSL